MPKKGKEKKLLAEAMCLGKEKKKKKMAEATWLGKKKLVAQRENIRTPSFIFLLFHLTKHTSKKFFFLFSL